MKETTHIGFSGFQYPWMSTISFISILCSWHHFCLWLVIFFQFFPDMPHIGRTFSHKVITFPNENIQRKESFLTTICEQMLHESKIICIWINFQNLSWTFLCLQSCIQFSYHEIVYSIGTFMLGFKLFRNGRYCLNLAKLSSFACFKGLYNYIQCS